MAASTTSLRAAYAKAILNQRVRHEYNGSSHWQGDGKLGRLDALPKPPQIAPATGDVLSSSICIIGAGTCGLYLAMMLKFLGFTNVHILEASDRVGGRCFTWPNPEPGSNPDHQYYDIGAMRIPELPWMEGTLSFIENVLGLKTENYAYSDANAPSLYRYKHDPIDDTQFKNAMEAVASKFLSINPKDPNAPTFDEAFADWLQGIKDPTIKTSDTSDPPPPKIFRDNFSTRAWLMTKADPPFSYAEAANAELSDTSTGLFDMSLTETVIDYVDFAFAKKKDVPWRRIEGGMQLVPNAMADKLASTDWPPLRPANPSWQVRLSTPVTKLNYDASAKQVSVETATGPKTSYDMVFNTTAMGPLQRMDLSGLSLPDVVLDAIRSLSYDRATKVAIKFKQAWWKTLYNISGGISGSDLPISNVVYPSWDVDDGPAVLMVSYSWAQDATRMGSMVADYSVPGLKRRKDDAIVTLCLNNLVQLFDGIPTVDGQAPITFESLCGLLEDDLADPFGTYHAWAWSHDPWTGGAFALFGPGQFQNVYPSCQSLLCPENPQDPKTKYHFALAGEALSAHHAWICGAFDSAYTTLATWLKSVGLEEMVQALKNSDMFGDGKGKHVQEFDEDLFGWIAHFSKDL